MGYEPHARGEYVSPAVEAELLTQTTDDGFPPLRLERGRGQIVLTSDAGPINWKSRGLVRVGIYAFFVRGTAYKPTAVRRADTRPGREVTVIREKYNPHDKNAVAVAVAPAGVVGYVNRQRAASLSKVMDAGTKVRGLMLVGAASGRDSVVVPRMLLAERGLLRHLCRDTDIGDGWL